jgi:hypothetical protein
MASAFCSRQARDRLEQSMEFAFGGVSSFTKTTCTRIVFAWNCQFVQRSFHSQSKSAHLSRRLSHRLSRAPPQKTEGTGDERTYENTNESFFGVKRILNSRGYHCELEELAFKPCACAYTLFYIPDLISEKAIFRRYLAMANFILLK